jgi:hypothetical protein
MRNEIQLAVLLRTLVLDLTQVCMSLFVLPRGGDKQEWMPGSEAWDCPMQFLEQFPEFFYPTYLHHTRTKRSSVWGMSVVSGSSVSREMSFNSGLSTRGHIQEFPKTHQVLFFPVCESLCVCYTHKDKEGR